jgi:hypothetical protein
VRRPGLRVVGAEGQRLDLRDAGRLVVKLPAHRVAELIEGGAGALAFIRGRR